MRAAVRGQRVRGGARGVVARSAAPRCVERRRAPVPGVHQAARARTSVDAGREVSDRKIGETVDGDATDTLMMRTRVVGTTHRNRDGTRRADAALALRAGAFVGLAREPHNEVDSSAVAVYTRGAGDEWVQVGYINRQAARVVSVLLDDDGWSVVARADRVEHSKASSRIVLRVCAQREYDVRR